MTVPLWHIDAVIGGGVYPIAYVLYVAAKQRDRDDRRRRDVLGEGTACIVATPGHAPGHSLLLVNLPESGPVVRSGDVTRVDAIFAAAIDKQRISKSAYALSPPHSAQSNR